MQKLACLITFANSKQALGAYAKENKQKIRGQNSALYERKKKEEKVNYRAQACVIIEPKSKHGHYL